MAREAEDRQFLLTGRTVANVFLREQHPEKAHTSRFLKGTLDKRLLPNLLKNPVQAFGFFTVCQSTVESDTSKAFGKDVGKESEDKGMDIQDFDFSFFRIVIVPNKECDIFTVIIHDAAV